MNDFDYDVMQKKRTASGARHRICGSKSRKCTLPQDAMTPKQLQERNGKMKTYDLSKPMKWRDFTSMPDDLRNEYIGKLRDRFNVSTHCLADMFGTSQNTVYMHLKKMGADLSRHRMSVEQAVEWSNFINSENSIPKEKPAEDAGAPVEKETQAKIDGFCAVGCLLENGTLTFTGRAPDIAIRLMKFLGDKSNRISVAFQEVEEA